jgi:outer membrane protein TolC
MSAAVADLRVLEVETEQRRTSLARRIDFSRRQMQDIRLRVEIGTAAPLDVAGAEVRLQELQLALTKADYELALIRRQLVK